MNVSVVRAISISVGAIVIASVFMLASPLFAQTDDYSNLAGTIDVAAYCPNLSVTMQRGARDASTRSQVTELQKFLSGYYDIDPEELVTGFFGRITQSYVQRFQAEQGLPTYGIAGSLTRARIASLCGGSDSGAVNFTVSPISGTIPLTATFSANLQAYASSGAGDIVLDYGDGQSGTLCRPGFSGVSACTAWSGPHTYTAAGTYVAQLIKKGGTCSVNNVSTACGAPDQIIGTVMVVASATSGNETLSASPISGSVPLTVQFTMEKLNLQGMGMKTYYLDFGDGSSMHTTNSIGKDGEIHVYAKAGSYVATLSVSKDCPPGYGCPAVLQNLASVTIAVSSGTSDAPVISGVSGPATLQVGQSGTWKVGASDPGNSALSYSVIWGDESAMDQLSILAGSPSSVQSSTFTHAYAKPGTYSPRFTVKNASGLSASAGVSVKVGDSVGNESFTASPTSGAAPLTVNFRTAAGDEEAYTVEFGDGTSAQLSVIEGGAARGVSHTYASAGTYTAQLVRKGGTCYLDSVATNCGAPDQRIGTVVIVVTGSSSGGSTCPQGYYMSLGSGCLPVQTQTVPGAGTTIATCPTGYTTTISGTCVATQSSGATTGNNATSCPSGRILSILGTCI